VAFFAHAGHRRFIHADHLGGVHDGQVVGAAGIAGQLLLDLRLVADEHDLHGQLAGGANPFGWSLVALTLFFSLAWGYFTAAARGCAGLSEELGLRVIAPPRP
jgi:hypothetical protein